MPVMAELKLILAPHELAPNRRADVDGKPFEFRAKWFDREPDFVGQVIGQHPTEMIFFAIADEPERGNFVNVRFFEPTDSALQQSRLSNLELKCRFHTKR